MNMGYDTLPQCLNESLPCAFMIHPLIAARVLPGFSLTEMSHCLRKV